MTGLLICSPQLDGGSWTGVDGWGRRAADVVDAMQADARRLGETTSPVSRCVRSRYRCWDLATVAEADGC